MAGASTKASTLTTLTIGQVEIAVGLFTAHAKPGGLAQFTTGGPNGGVLKARSVARAAPVDETVERPDVPVGRSDPLAEDPGPDPSRPAEAAIAHAMEHTAAAASAVDGAYGRELYEEGTGEVVAPEDVRRGVRLEDGSFVDCTEQLAEIEEQTKLERMSVVSFVDITRIARARTSATYYVGAADEKAPKPLRLIYQALRATRRGAVVKVTKRSRQSLGVIAPLGKVLVFYELVWLEDFRSPPPKALALQKAHVSDKEVAQACALINAMSDGVESMNELRDDALALREKLFEQASAGEFPQVVVPKVERDEQDVMAQLEASLAAVA